MLPNLQQLILLLPKNVHIHCMHFNQYYKSLQNFHIIIAILFLADRNHMLATAM